MKFPSVAAVALIPLALAPLFTLAFSDTAPLLAYTSRSLGSSGAGAGASASQADGLAALKRAASSGDDARGPALYSRDAARLLASDRRALCDEIDGIALIQIEELNSHSLQGLPASSGLKQRILSADSQIGLQHISERTGYAAQEVERALQQACAGRKGWAARDGGKSKDKRSLMTDVAEEQAEELFYARDLSESKEGQAQQKRMFKFSSSFRKLEDGTLEKYLGQFEGAFKRHLVVLTRSAPSLSARAAAGAERKKKEGEKRDHVADGLLHYYQFWTSGLLLSALIVALLFLPICYIAVSMIGAISTPDKLGEKSRLTEMSKKAT